MVEGGGLENRFPERGRGFESYSLRQALNRLLKNVTSAVKTRQDPTKKRSLCVINEHFEKDLNAVLSSAVVFQQPVKVRPTLRTGLRRDGRAG